MLIGRRWRRALPLGLGLPLLFGSTPVAAAGSASALGGFTTFLGVLAALWAVVGPRADAPSLGKAWLPAHVAVVSVSGLALWRHQRGRVGSARRRATALALPWLAVRDEVKATAVSWPAALDGKQVLDAARSRFLRLQAAWDAGDVHALGHLTTPDMLEQLLSALGARCSGTNRTEVITLHAEVLGAEEVTTAYLVSVEFSGLIRETAEEGAVPFRELWMLRSGKEGSPSWRLARQQALL